MLSQRSSSIQNQFPLDASEVRMLSQPAPFGKGEETIFDETIRKAWQIEPSQFTFDYSWIETISKIQTEVSTTLGTSSDVRFEFYKMVGYDQDGHFDWHRDTLRAPDHFATFLVSLPVLGSHEEGTLEVCEPGVRPSSEQSGTSLRWTGQTSGLQASWCCFYTDCYHKLHPVTRGSRVVLAYNVFNGDAKKEKEEEENEEEEEEKLTGEEGGKEQEKEEDKEEATSPDRSSVDISAQMQEVISQALAQREEVCIQLLHQYPEISDPRFLKGSDRLMYEILRQAYPPRQVPVLVSGVDGDVDGDGDRERVEGVRTEEQMSCGSFQLNIMIGYEYSYIEFDLPHKLLLKDPIVFEVRPDSVLTETIIEEEVDDGEDSDYDYSNQMYPVRYFNSPKVAFLFNFKDACFERRITEEEWSHWTGNQAAPRILYYRPMYLRISSSSKESDMDTTHKKKRRN